MKKKIWPKKDHFNAPNLPGQTQNIYNTHAYKLKKLVFILYLMLYKTIISQKFWQCHTTFKNIKTKSSAYVPRNTCGV